MTRVYESFLYPNPCLQNEASIPFKSTGRDWQTGKAPTKITRRGIENPTAMQRQTLPTSRRKPTMSDIKNLTPPEAWHILQTHTPAILIDVRDPVEYLMVGYPPGAINIPWKFAPDWRINPDFVQQVRERVPDRAQTVLLICRSGQRSHDAAQALSADAYLNLINISEGFEGALDDNKQRGRKGGWRFHGLPWQQS